MQRAPGGQIASYTQPSSSRTNPFQSEGGGHRYRIAEVQTGLEAYHSSELLSDFHKVGGRL